VSCPIEDYALLGDGQTMLATLRRRCLLRPAARHEPTIATHHSDAFSTASIPSTIPRRAATHS